MLRHLVFLLPFLLSIASEVHAANLLTNSGFDTDIAGWSFSGNCSQSWDSFGSGSSDGALAVNCFAPSMAAKVSQCVRISPMDVDFSGEVSNNGVAGPVAFGLASYATDDCTQQPTLVLDPAGTSVTPSGVCCGTEWTTFSRTNISLPTTTRSVLVEITVTTPADISLDNIQLGPSASGPAISAATSGAWYNAEQSGYGFLVQILPNHTFLAVWFVFTPDASAQSWLYMQGPYDPASNKVTISDVLIEDGGKFPPNFDSTKIGRTHWGTATFTFTGCNDASVTWESTLPGYGSGSMKLTRLAGIAQLSCN